MLFAARDKPPLYQKRPKGDCAVARPFFSVFVFIFVFDFLFFSISQAPSRASHMSRSKFDWPFVQNKDRSLNPRRGRRRRGYLIKCEWRGGAAPFEDVRVVLM